MTMYYAADSDGGSMVDVAALTLALLHDGWATRVKTDRSPATTYGRLGTTSRLVRVRHGLTESTAWFDRTTTAEYARSLA